MGLGFKLAAEVDATEATALEKARIGELGGRVSFLCCAYRERTERGSEIRRVLDMKPLAHNSPPLSIATLALFKSAYPRYLNTF